MSMCTSDRDQAIQDRVNAKSRADEDWINDSGEFSRDYAGEFLAWLLAPVGLLVEKLAERLGWWE